MWTSDLDGSRTMGANKGGYGIGTTQTSTGPTTGTTAGSQTLPGTGSAAYGETAGNQNFSGTTAQTSTGATGTIPGTGQTSTGPSTGAMTGTTAGGQSLPGTAVRPTERRQTLIPHPTRRRVSTTRKGRMVRTTRA